MYTDEKEEYKYNNKMLTNYDFFIKECGILSIRDQLVRIHTLCIKYDYDFHELLVEEC